MSALTNTNNQLVSARSELCQKSHQRWHTCPRFETELVPAQHPPHWTCKIHLPNGKIVELATKFTRKILAENACSAKVLENWAEISQSNATLSINFEEDSDEECDDKLETSFLVIREIIQQGHSCEVRFVADGNGQLNGFYIGSTGL